MGKLLLQLDFIRQTVWAFAEQQTHYSFMRTTPVDANRCVMRAAHFRIRMQIFFFSFGRAKFIFQRKPVKIDTLV